ncbi:MULTISPECIES: DUF1697 domain-containing protein [Cyanophyceae]|uniref:DUF1697 domain-containing protein n=1 Tax=Cyanophyceae TaxID=3028117 RepID=UPI001686C617|nr:MULTISPECIES: DUF1697 domain-containing protein [Cyanophyceae]MBD1918383.1 DUF1697 domain-containing protein [Phormidium sp. FACHB-77]MBD2028748.1 DUF1697 domain-containing protein [Phormidium sp. FACHB-322]MBD2051169.1 DUF1697 domain-containing protein [Leptolyngbya sp. FACHB-60]
MTTYIALIRGINVGGKSHLPMKALVAMLEEVGCRQVKTYIQSGNAVFESEEKDVLKLSSQISCAIGQQYNFAPCVLILEIQEIQRAIAENPFPQASADPKAVHLGFLATPPEHPKLEKLEALRKDSEDFRLLDKVFYLYAPEGIGRSKLAAHTEKLLGVAMTSRNWQTVSAIWDIAQSLERSS